MAGFAHILCPIDSSEHATRALRYAAAFAARHGARLTVMTVRPPMPALGIWASHNLMLPPELPGERERTFASFSTFVRETTGRDDVRVLLQDGPVVAEILRVAREASCDLIVMGTHGASGLERLVLGSTTEKVLRRTPVPVLTIPPGTDAPPAPLRMVLCAIDRSDAAMQGLAHAVALARDAGARLVLAHVVEQWLDEDPRFARHFGGEDCFRGAEPELRAWYLDRVPDAARADVAADLELRCGKATRELLAIAEDRRPDLIVLGTASTSAIFGSTAHGVVRAAHVPVLVVPPPSPQENPHEQHPD